MRTILTLILVGFVFSAAAQIDTNKPARFKMKIVSHGSASENTSIISTPDAIFPGSEGADTVTNSGQESELKWKFIGRMGGKDVYHFTFTRTMKDAISKTGSSKDVLFDGKRAVIFEDEFHRVIIDSPSEQDLKGIAPREQIFDSSFGRPYSTFLSGKRPIIAWLAFSPQTGDTLRVIAVETNEHEIRVKIPTDGMSPEAVRAFLDWLRIEAAARQSHLTDQAAWKLSEDIKSDWWAKNKSRFNDERK